LYIISRYGSFSYANRDYAAAFATAVKKVVLNLSSGLNLEKVSLFEPLEPLAKFI
jgi:hypothetical protein